MHDHQVLCKGYSSKYGYTPVEKVNYVQGYQFMDVSGELFNCLDGSGDDFIYVLR